MQTFEDSSVFCLFAFIISSPRKITYILLKSYIRVLSLINTIYMYLLGNVWLLFFQDIWPSYFFSLKNGMKSWCYPFTCTWKDTVPLQWLQLQKPDYYLKDHQRVGDHWMNHNLSTSGVIHWWKRRKVDWNYW